jgi:ribosomal protein L29
MFKSSFQDVKERLNTLEAELSESRNQLALGYKDPQVMDVYVAEELFYLKFLK